MNSFGAIGIKTTSGSLGKSIVKLDQLISRAKELNMAYLGVMDDQLFCHDEFIEACIANDIIPITMKLHTSTNTLDAYVFGENQRIALLQIKKFNDKLIDDINTLKPLFAKLCISVSPVSAGSKHIHSSTLSIANESGLPMVITNDVRYLNQDDAIAYNTYMNQQNVKTYQWLMDEEEIRLNIRCDKQTIKRMMENTNRLACEVMASRQKKVRQTEETNTLALSIITEETYRQLYKKQYEIDVNQYASRLEHELSVIRDLGFAENFYVAKRLIDQSSARIGPGRGSACGSLVAYLMGITSVDPIRYNLSFERFLSVHRNSDPDIDIDVASSDREKMIDAAVAIYGEEKCASITTKNKTTIDDIYRKIMKKTSKENHDILLMKEMYDHDGTMLHALTDVYQDNVVNQAALYIFPYGHSYCPIKMDKLQVIEKEKINHGIRLDLLSSRYLDKLNHIEKRIGKTIDYETMDLTDERTWELISSADTDHVYQLSSDLCKRKLPLIKPKSIQELSHALALLRKSSLMAKADVQYIEAKETQEIASYGHWFDIVVEETYGQLIFQEQIMEFCSNIGLSHEFGYTLIKTAAKKEPIDALVNTLITQCKSVGMKQESIHHVTTTIQQSVEYTYNKSHAIAYALFVYKSAYLKANYTVEFATIMNEKRG